MDFEDTPEEAAFRKEVRAWIDANAPKHLEAELRRANFGSSGVVSEDPIAAGKAWQKKKAEAGWAWARLEVSWLKLGWAQQMPDTPPLGSRC